MIELYKKYRPQRFKEVIGQDEAISSLVQMGRSNRIPHCILFSGPSGCGKTTLARILVKMLKCSEADFFEMNTADFRGIEMVREIRRRMSLAPMGGSCRIWLVDECHKLTSDAQDAFLKILEDTPDHVYFFLATTEPNRLKKTIITRSTEVKVRPLDNKLMEKLVSSVAQREHVKLDGEVVDRIVDYAGGSPRKALVLLHQVIGLGDAEQQLDAISKADYKAQAIELARKLINPRTKWADVAAVLKTLDDDAESLRRMLLGYSQSVLLRGGKMADRAYQVIDVLRDPLYDVGKPGLTAACYEIIRGS